MTYKRLMAATAVAAVCATGAFASTVGDVLITSVTGEWTGTTGTTASGIGTNQISWGSPAFGGDQSSYLFAGVAPPTQGPFAENDVFALGDFTHFNNPIFAPSITGATLEVLTEGTVDGAAFSITSVFEFDHDETPNTTPCDPASVSVCDDVVTPTLNAGASESVTVGGVDYFIAVTGFMGMDGGFLTLEGETNVATLQGTFTADVNVVPLPAAGWMLLAGIGGIAAMKRRKKAA